MSHITRRRTALAPAPALVSDYGSPRIPKSIEEVAIGTRATIKRARRNHLGGIVGITRGMEVAAERFSRAWEHLCDGRGMGPLDPQVERSGGHPGLSVRLLAQERAITSAEWHRIGEQAIGLMAYPVVHWVVVKGGGVRAYDIKHGWRNGTASVVLVAALGRLAEAYECA